MTARQPDPVDSCEYLGVDGTDHLGITLVWTSGTRPTRGMRIDLGPVGPQFKLVL